MDYNFLNNLVLDETDKVKQPKGNNVNPEGLAVRIMKDGRVYPSPQLVEQFKLQYERKDSTEKTYGFDVVDSAEWSAMKAHHRMILFGVTEKSEPKVDLFGLCRYNDDGTPKSDVLTQGSPNKDLLDLVKSMGYLKDGQKYCDLQVVLAYPIHCKEGLSFIPKVMEKGVNKGQKTYERREGTVYYPVNVIDNLVSGEEQSVEISRDEETEVLTVNVNR